MPGIEERLREELEGEVRFDRLSRTIYSVDASIYEIEPVGVAIPKTRDDLRRAVIAANDYGVPIIPRGAATGIAGGAIGAGLVVDTSKFLNQILHVDYEQEQVVCEPGVVQDHLNAFLSEKGYRLGPDTSTGNRATLGGMLANNSSGARSLRYGMMVHHILEAELVLPQGEIIRLKALAPDEVREKCQLKSPEGHLYREITRILQEYETDIREHFPKLPRRASGFNLDHVWEGKRLNLAKLVAGSEGTLGLVSELTLKIVPRPLFTGLSVLHFEDMIQALHQVPYYLESDPLSLEMIDHQIIKMGRLSPSLRGRLDWLKGDPQALFVAEFEGDSLEEVREKIHAFETQISRQGTHYHHIHLLRPKEMDHVWALRKAGLGLLLSRRTYSRAIGFLEDVAVAPDKLGAFMAQFLQYLEKHNKQAGVYGHVGAGCVHVRPFINLRQENELHLMKRMMVDVADLLLEYGGTLSGEHGDGLVRSWLNEKMFGKRLYRAFIEVKKAFDPDSRMNPGKVVEGPDLHHNLRISPDTHSTHFATAFDFSREGGLELSVDLCNGNGQCRNRSGLMCPSFQAYGDESHSTRARAQMFRSVVNGRLSPEAFTGPELYQVLEYCLECKGCKTECPSQVDMAKLKSEFLYHYQKKHGASLRSRLFAQVAKASRLASKAPSLANWWITSWFGRRFLRFAGVSPQRTQPLFALQPFSSWLDSQPPLSEGQGPLVLLNDTYTEFYYPEIGVAAYKFLSSMGYQVIVPPWQCCGRPLISKGFLKQAKRQAERLVETLYPYAKEKIPIIGLEPSCLSAIKDDYRDLFSGNMTRQVSDHTHSLEEWLHLEEVHLSFSRQQGTLLFHNHCHQKSLVGSRPTLSVLKSIPGLQVSEIPSGCCGLAGSFGYEAEHYDMSMAIGEDRLFPAIRQAEEETIIVANGVSCRSQIQHGTGRKAYHLAEVLHRCQPKAEEL